ncbi:MAG: M20/M25/M40 family metallo-hydrolase [Rubrivivax sp.]|nr:M20/M25/M40 family metallo-hydrolase [Rubrivivax sp.]
MDTDTPSPEGVAWAQRLVRFNTVSHQSNLALVECIADHLRTLGVPLRLTWDEERHKANLFATLGVGKPGGLVLSGHTDTVPWDGQDWTTNPLAAEVRDGRLYGRGSAEMKGWIGTVVAQAAAWLQADLPFALHYAFSYDEEVGGFGARHLIADLRDSGLAPRLCSLKRVRKSNDEFERDFWSGRSLTELNEAVAKEAATAPMERIFASMREFLKEKELRPREPRTGLAGPEHVVFPNVWCDSAQTPGAPAFKVDILRLCTAGRPCRALDRYSDCGTFHRPPRLA